MKTAPASTSSSPASMRSAVVFPEPDGPTRTMNSPSAMSRSSASTAGALERYPGERDDVRREALHDLGCDGIVRRLGQHHRCQLDHPALGDLPEVDRLRQLARRLEPEVCWNGVLEAGPRAASVFAA